MSAMLSEFLPRIADSISNECGLELFRYVPVFRSELLIVIASPLIGGQAGDQLAFRCATLQQFDFSIDVKHGCSNTLAATVPEAPRELSISNKGVEPKIVIVNELRLFGDRHFGPGKSLF